MNNNLIELLPKEVKKSLRQIEKIIKEQALPAAEMFKQRGEITVIPHRVAMTHVELFPAMFLYSISKRTLANPALLKTKRLKVVQQFETFKYIEDAIPELTEKDFDHERLATIILRKGCTDILPLIETDELCLRASMFFPNIDFIREIEKRNQISLAQYDLSELKDYHFDLLSDTDKAVNFSNEETIIPLQIYCKFLLLAQLLASLHVFAERIAVAKTLGKKRDDLQTLSKEINELLRHWIEAYPFLSGTPLHDIDRLLLDFYTRPPSEIIEMFGPDEICFPYEVPDEMKNSPFNPLNN